MLYKRKAGSFLRIIIASIVVSALLAGLTSGFASAATETDYIVKYTTFYACLTENGAPFDVVSREEAERLYKAGLLEWYEPDGDAELLGTVSPFFGDEQWNLDMIGAEAAFSHDHLGQGVRVGVLDSGVSPHPDFGDRLLPGRNYMPDGDSEDTEDHYGHGTRVAGLIAAAGEEGYIGCAPAAEIVPLKVTDGKSVKVSAICEAVYGAIDEYGCTVLNLSLGVLTDYQALREAMEYAESKNVVVVSAVGNSGNTELYYPAGYDTVIGVGAVNGKGNIYHYSCSNESVFLTAPGVNVRSTSSEGGYATSSGTSFSVAQVSGAAAVLLGIDGSLTPSEIRTLFAETAADKGEPGYDAVYGYGVLNLAGCIDALSTKENGDMPDEPPITVVFADVPEDSWYADAVAWAVEKGITSGTDETHFSPAAPCTRAQLVTFLWRAAGEPEPVGPEPPFTDITGGSYYEKVVCWASETGVTSGVDATHFAPDDTVNRAQTVTFLYRFAKAEAEASDAFEDVEPDAWYAASVAWAAESGITTGTGNATFSPYDACVRAQTVTFLYRLMGYG